MELNDYQTRAASTADYPDRSKRNANAINYTVLGLVSLAGAIAHTWKTGIRNNDGTIARETMRYILGDTLWYVARLATELGMTLEQVAECNLEKQRDLLARNALKKAP